MSLRLDPSPVEHREPLERVLGRLIFGRSVGTWIPTGFDHCARILHPAHLWEATEDHVAGLTVTWSEVGAWSGQPLQRSSTFHDLARRADGTSWRRQGTSGPSEGQLEPAYLDRLTNHLAEATTTANALWFLVWEGYGAPGEPYRIARRKMPNIRGRRFPRTRRSRMALGRAPAVAISPALTGSGRKYFLHRGSIGVSSDNLEPRLFEEPPSFWWPEDHAWFVSTDIDSSSTYVGGSSGLIDRLLADDLLEVLPASRNDPYDGTPHHEELHGAK